MARKPLGIHSRQTADWFIDNAYGAFFNSAAVAGQLSYVGLFNNSRAGDLLYVYGVYVRSGTAVDVLAESFKGNPGGTVVSVVPLRFDQSAAFGVVTTFSNAVCIGTAYSDLGFSVQGQSWPNYFPIAKVPPGFAFLVHGSAVNDGVLGSLVWHIFAD
jgi:hypothetical protein